MFVVLCARAWMYRLLRGPPCGQPWLCSCWQTSTREHPRTQTSYFLQVQVAGRTVDRKHTRPDVGALELLTNLQPVTDVMTVCMCLFCASLCACECASVCDGACTAACARACTHASGRARARALKAGERAGATVRTKARAAARAGVDA